jgi:ABC-type phosphate transport system auxiliary subunit
MDKSIKEGLTEAEYLAVVERIQQAMCIEPFRPDVTDVVMLIGAWRVQQRENERLLLNNAELSAECDQWGEKVAELWAERERHQAEFREQITEEHAAYQELHRDNQRLRQLLGTISELLETFNPDA